MQRKEKNGIIQNVQWQKNSGRQKQEQRKREQIANSNKYGRH